MIYVLLVFLSGAAGALYGLSYKFREQKNYSMDVMLFLFALFSVVFSLIFILIFGEPFYSWNALLLGVLYGFTMVITVGLYLRVTARAKLNISWTIIQFSVLIPFFASIILFNEKLKIKALIGTLLIFTSILFFGLGKKDLSGKRAVPNLKTGLFLLFSSLFTGIAMTFPKVYAVVEKEAGPFTLLFYRGLSTTLVSGIILIARKIPDLKSRFKPGLFIISANMGLMGLLVTAFIIIALRGGIPGSIAFPVRTVVNVLTVFLLSFILFKEKVRLLEGFGVIIALAGIVIVSASVV